MKEVGFLRGWKSSLRSSLDADQLLDNDLNRIKRRKTALGDDAVGRTIGFFELRIGLRVPCDLFPQRRNPLTGDATEPEKWPERQSIRIKEYPEDACGRPLEQFDMCGHLRTPRSVIARPPQLAASKLGFPRNNPAATKPF